MADAASHRDDGAGLEFSGGTLLVLRARPGGAGRARRSTSCSMRQRRRSNSSSPPLPEYGRWTVLLETARRAADRHGIPVRMRRCKRRPARSWHFRGRHDGERTLRRGAAFQRRHFPPVGSRRQARRRDARSCASDAGRRTRAGTNSPFQIAAPARCTDIASTAKSRCPIRRRTSSREDVSGPSEVIDHDQFEWRADDMARAAVGGRGVSRAARRHLHAGRHVSIRDREARLIVEAGVTAIELMPIADFAGRRNWGYDGVLLYAPDSSYGRPDDLRALIDAAHLRGLMVFLDVVYNHFGPGGKLSAPLRTGILRARRTRPGDTPSTIACRRCAPLRSRTRCIGSRRYRFDGLRLDAVHAIVEPGRALDAGMI